MGEYAHRDNEREAHNLSAGQLGEMHFLIPLHHYRSLEMASRSNHGMIINDSISENAHELTNVDIVAYDCMSRNMNAFPPVFQPRAMADRRITWNYAAGEGSVQSVDQARKNRNRKTRVAEPVEQ